MTASQEMEWVLAGVGWAKWRWSVEGETHQFGVSYTGQALETLLDATADLRLGARFTYATLESEPEGWRVFFAAAGEEVFVQVVQYPYMQDEFRWNDAVLLWAKRIDMRSFIDAVRGMTDDLLAKHGRDGYAREFGKPFPAGPYERLTGEGGHGES
ncbi:hypothetical protein [Streptomyces venezuelae]|uniref:hypothetical protein n=1 Tax=Streptomyces venezuelae TaxID=54571 RepID=UPI00123D3B02|nr:hypothetical protein [Streptomyces venezuelae]